METEMLELEVWIMVDEDGDYEVAKEQDAVSEEFENNIGVTRKASRMVKMTVKVPAPKPLEVEVEVPAEDGTITAKVG